MSRQMSLNADRRVNENVANDMAGSNRGTKRKHTDMLSEAPRELVIIDFVESRAREIQVLSQEVECTDGSKKLTQRLPRHMRRRAMSHNIKRLPQRFRDMAKAEYTNQEGLVKKVPSRKHRRRPKNLLQEYNRRQRKNIWLETHIWHAKRFHMVEKWGFKLPLKPTEKSGRAAYRASKQYCLLQDMSYMCCIELTGAEDLLLSHLSLLTNAETGPTFAAKSTLSGTREGHLVLYHMNSYPWKAIGSVSFLWKPKQVTVTENRTLWIWCHCCCIDEVWNQLLKCFNLEDKIIPEHKRTSEKTKEANDSSDSNTDDEQDKNSVRQYLSELVAENETVCMKSLAGSLLRFRLTGPLSNAVLADCLQQADIVSSKTAETQTAEDNPWWESYFKQRELSLGHTHQREMMESLAVCQSPAELPPHCVLGMTVQDPRVTRPQKRTKVAQAFESEETYSQGQVTPDVSTSAIWESSIREEVKKTKLSDHELNTLKSEQLVPGTGIDLRERESKVPILLIQQPGIMGSSANQFFLGYSSGWDLVLPAGWGMPFWLSLVFRGARTGGLQETLKVADEGRTVLFPNEFPDSQSGERYEKETGLELLKTYKRKPPAKRPNFVKLGVISPFCCPWEKLVYQDIGKSSACASNGNSAVASDSSNDADNAGSDFKSETNGCFYVLRNRKTLKQLQGELARDRKSRIKGKPQSRSGNTQQCLQLLRDISTQHQQALVAVQVDLLIKGNPSCFAMICLPTQDDFEKLKESKSYGGPEEQLHQDPITKQMKIQKKLVKSGQMKKAQKIIRPDPFVSGSEISNEDFNNSASRHVIGYLTSGGSLFSSGNGGGKGFCAVVGLCHLLVESVSESQPLVLLRNPTSLQYRFAKLSVIVG